MSNTKYYISSLLILLLFISYVNSQKITFDWYHIFLNSNESNSYQMSPSFDQNVYVTRDQQIVMNMFHNTSKYQGPVMMVFNLNDTMTNFIEFTHQTPFPSVMQYDIGSQMFLVLSPMQSLEEAFLYGVSKDDINIKWTIEMNLEKIPIQMTPFIVYLELKEFTSNVVAVSNEDGKNVLWKTSIDLGYNNTILNTLPTSVTNAQSTYILMQNSTSSIQVICFNRKSGEYLWTQDFELQDSFNLAYLTIGSFGDYIYISENFELILLDYLTGSVLWSIPSCTGPLYNQMNSILYCLNITQPMENFTLLAYSMNTREIMWNLPLRDGGVYWDLSDDSLMLYLIDANSTGFTNLVIYDSLSGTEEGDYFIPYDFNFPFIYSVPTNSSSLVFLDLSQQEYHFNVESIGVINVPVPNK